MICPDCGAELQQYKVEVDVHTHWCNKCERLLILRNGKWISTQQALGELEKLKEEFEMDGWTIVGRKKKLS